MNIVLIGFSGSGKSAVGQLMAQQLGWEFVDTDVEVERRAGLRIHEIFVQKGEAAFRRLEAESVRQALQGTRRVVSLGGGAVVDPANRETVRNGNLVVLLDAGVDTLHRRLSQAAGDEPRPMLGMGGHDGETGRRGDGVMPDSGPQSAALARIEALKAARDPIYRETAHVTVSTEGAELEGVVARVRDAVERALGDEAVTEAGL